MTVRVTAADEAYGHQLVAPRAQTEHDHPNWQERCYHLLFAGDFMVNMGRAVWPHAGVRRAFVGVATADAQHVVRTEVALQAGDDPEDPVVDGVRVETTVPLREVALQYDDPDGRFALDLAYTARMAPVATTPHLVEQGGAVATHYMNFFQSGWYDGWVRIGDDRHVVAGRAGFRDRGWGVRKHEGSPGRGLVLAAMCELGDRALYLLLFETASGRRVLQDGWLMHADGRVERAATIDHALELDGGRVTGGTLDVGLEGGAHLHVTFQPRLRLFLSAVGYSPVAARQAPGRETYTLIDPATTAALNGQIDHGAMFTVDGAIGHGYVETGIGDHARYRPTAPEGGAP